MASGQWPVFEISGGFGIFGAAYLCLPEPLREVSLAELALEELSFEELSLAEASFDELSFVEVSDLDLSSFLSLESPPEPPGEDDFLA